ncbi:helix-turn-helix domain-containing protein [Plantactinospora sp. CA-294935]|uniref:helix-turn-helix domain-containing protein n=1 Tax=Plantactinospora sp. CA-294935 TaxID=3240012 RepID=UPI003D945193
MADTNEFRHLLRRLRVERGMSQDAVGAEVHVSGSQIGHYESGRSVPADGMADALDRALGASGELVRAADRSRGDSVAPWLRPWEENEARAVILRWFEPSVIPGLLQTDEYARAVTAAGPHTPDQVEEAVQTRIRRQAAVFDRPTPVVLTAIIGEAVLRHGDPGVMKRQLEHLVDVGHRPNVHVRVVPFTAGLHVGHAGAFAVATLTDGASVAYVDHQLSGDVAAKVRDLLYLGRAWESICAVALPWSSTRELILRVIDDHGAALAKEQP